MATKASARYPNASAASSSSSSSSRRSYRNSSFGRESSVDRWDADADSSLPSTGKPHQQNVGKWGSRTPHAASGGGVDLGKGKSSVAAERNSGGMLYSKQAMHGYADLRSPGMQPLHQSSGQSSRWPVETTSDAYVPKRGSWKQPVEPQSEGVERKSRISSGFSAPDQPSASKKFEVLRGQCNSAARPLSEGMQPNYVNAAYNMRGQPKFQPPQTSKDHSSRSSWNQAARPRAQGIEQSCNVWNPNNPNNDVVFPPLERSKDYGKVRGDWNQMAKPQVDTSELNSLILKVDEPNRWRGGQNNNDNSHAAAEVRPNSHTSHLSNVHASTVKLIPESGSRRFEAFNNHHHHGSDMGFKSRGTSSNKSVSGYRNAGALSDSKEKWRLADNKGTWRPNGHSGPVPDRRHASFQQTSSAERKGSFKHTTSFVDNQKDMPAVQTLARDDWKEENATKDQPVSILADADGVDGTPLPFVMGTCEDMCPAREREQRERLRDLTVFERLYGNPRKTSKELAVKKFCRTFSGLTLHPSDVRPLPVLWSTLHYLLNLLDDREFSYDVVHNFLFDRTRAIRQELGMQRVVTSQAVTMYEEIVRFHILSEHELSQRGSGRHASDLHLNLQQLSKSLSSLFDLYDLRMTKRMENEAEFRAYYVLLNLGNFNRHQGESLALWFRRCPATLLNSPELAFARKVLRSYQLDNFKTFFQLALEATFLQGCLMELHFNEVRLKSLEAINQGAYKLHPFPLSDIAKLLAMKEGDLEELCNLCNLGTGLDVSRVRCLLVKQSQFIAPKEIPYFRCPVLSNKKSPSNYEEVVGVNGKDKNALVVYTHIM